MGIYFTSRKVRAILHLRFPSVCPFLLFWGKPFLLPGKDPGEPLSLDKTSTTVETAEKIDPLVVHLDEDLLTPWTSDGLPFFRGLGEWGRGGDSALKKTAQ